MIRFHARVLAAMLVLAASRAAFADCCRVVKTDAETPPATVRVCEPARVTPDGCGSVLHLGTLDLGESVEVCSPTATIRYAEFDDRAADFGPSVEAVCQGDVEI